jgi:hypothetical protein
MTSSRTRIAAAVFSLILPGAGQLYLGAGWRGAWLFAGYVGLLVAVYGFPDTRFLATAYGPAVHMLLIIARLAFPFYAAFDAAAVARKALSAEPRWYRLWPVVLFGAVMIVTGLEHFRHYILKRDLHSRYIANAHHAPALQEGDRVLVREGGITRPLYIYWARDKTRIGMLVR